MSPRKLWQRLKAWSRREVLVAVPMGFDKPTKAKPGDDPRFLREMAESMGKCRVVYENMNIAYQRRLEILQAPPPTTTQAARDSLKWQKDQASIEAALLRELLSGPINCAKALNDLANRKTALQRDEFSNWTLERTDA